MSFLKTMLGKLTSGQNADPPAVPDALTADDAAEGPVKVYGYGGAQGDYALSPSGAPREEPPLGGQPEPGSEAQGYEYPGLYAQRYDGIDKGGAEQAPEGELTYKLNETIGGDAGVEADQGLDPDTSSGHASQTWWGESSKWAPAEIEEETPDADAAEGLFNGELVGLEPGFDEAGLRSDGDLVQAAPEDAASVDATAPGKLEFPNITFTVPEEDAADSTLLPLATESIEMTPIQEDGTDFDDLDSDDDGLLDDDQ
jgi:hypothetical protein